MPTLEHNSLIEMFRENPDIAPRFLSTLFGVAVPPYATVSVIESSLDQLIPIEFRADLVLELRDANGVLVLAIVLEVQRDDDPGKKYTWPVYVAVVRARKRCPTVVLVVAPDAEVATWAAQPIDLGLGLGTVQPLVLGASSVRRAREVVARQTKNKATFPPFMQRFIDGSRLEGEIEGFREGELRGLREGELKGLREVLLRLTARAGLTLTDDDRARIRTCDDAATLDRWVENVIGAKSIDEVLS